MKFLSALLPFLVISCASSNPASDNYYRVAKHANMQIKEVIPVKVTGVGAMIPKQIRAYSMIFHTKEPISIDQGRCYILKMVQILLVAFNSDLAIQEYLENKPFTPKNLRFSIFVDMWDEFEPPTNFVSVITFASGTVIYERYNLCKNTLELIGSETYEEALQKCPSFGQPSQL